MSLLLAWRMHMLVFRPVPKRDISAKDRPCSRIQGTTTVLAMARLRTSVAALLGKGVGQAFMLLTCLQFHLPFYASRPLPNTFALAIASLAHADWISANRPERAIVLMAIAVVLPHICSQVEAMKMLVLLSTVFVMESPSSLETYPCITVPAIWTLQVMFRCDLLPWAGLMGMHMLLTKQISIGKGLAVGALAAACSLALTILVDSVFWGRWLWPEGEVLWFNTAENRCQTAATLFPSTPSSACLPHRNSQQRASPAQLGDALCAGVCCGRNTCVCRL